MKRKYYLRGLGLGILITALVFILVGPSELSEEEIIKRAEELGYTKMEEEITPSIGLKDLLENVTSSPIPTEPVSVTNTPTPTEVPTPVPTESPAPTEVPSPTETPVPTATPTVTPAPTATATPIPTNEPEQFVVTATITVERGNTATVVCNKIEKAGILQDGDVLREYLISNNLTDYINVGSYTLSSDMSLKEIAKVLTGK